jgi:hypothetical protein
VTPRVSTRFECDHNKHQMFSILYIYLQNRPECSQSAQSHYAR